MVFLHFPTLSAIYRFASPERHYTSLESRAYHANVFQRASKTEPSCRKANDRSFTACGLQLQRDVADAEVMLQLVRDMFDKGVSVGALLYDMRGQRSAGGR